MAFEIRLSFTIYPGNSDDLDRDRSLPHLIIFISNELSDVRMMDINTRLPRMR